MFTISLIFSGFRILSAAIFLQWRRHSCLLPLECKSERRVKEELTAREVRVVRHPGVFQKLLNGQQVLHFVQQCFEPVGFCDYRRDAGAMGVGVGNGVSVQSEKNNLRWRMSRF